MSKTVSSALQQLLDLFKAKGSAFRPHSVRLQLSENFGECSVGNFGKTINSPQSKTCEQDPITPDILKLKCIPPEIIAVHN